MINPALMIHTATAFTIESMTADRKPVYDEGITLSNIRVSLIKGFNNGDKGLEVSDTMTLYFDCNLSFPLGWKPVEKMKIEYQGGSYTVKSVKAHYGVADTPAYYTAELV